MMRRLTRHSRTFWAARAFALGTLACLTTFSTLQTGQAQNMPTSQERRTGLPTGQSAVINATPDVHFDQKVNMSVPVDLPFKDESGKSVMLREYINGKQPVLLMMPFFKCAGACNTEQQGLMAALNQVKYQPGHDFQVVIVSINPKETPEIASVRKTAFTTSLANKKALDGIHYLTGAHEDIHKLADSIGYHYVESLQTEQFGHATGFVILTPQGKTFRYFYGSDYNPRDMKLALTEAGENKIGTVVDQLLVLCYHYDPTTGKYGFLIWRVSQVLGIATVLILATSIGMMLRWEKRHGYQNTEARSQKPEIEPGSAAL